MVKSGIDSKLRASYKKRKNCVKKKASELATLCGVNVCVVCIGPEGDVESWPENHNEVRSIIDMYKDCLQNGKNKKRARIEVGRASDDLLLSVVDEKLKKINEKIEFLKNRVQEDYPIVSYCGEITRNCGFLNFDMDNYDQDLLWDELEDKTRSHTRSWTDLLLAGDDYIELEDEYIDKI